MGTIINGVRYLSPAEYAQSMRRSLRTIRAKLARGLIDGAIQVGGPGRRWIIPSTAHMADGRVRSGRYIGYRWRRAMRDIGNEM